MRSLSLLHDFLKYIGISHVGELYIKPWKVRLPFKITDIFTRREALNLVKVVSELIEAGAVYDKDNDLLHLPFFQGTPRFKLSSRTYIFPPIIFAIHEQFIREVYGQLIGNEILRHSDILIDIGAFIGDTPIYFALKGVKHIIAIEPIPFYYSILVENIKLNKLEHMVKTRCVAIGDSYSILELKLPSFKYIGTNAIKVHTIPFNELLDQYDEIDVVKMDCEGCEF